MKYSFVRYWFVLILMLNFNVYANLSCDQLFEPVDLKRQRILNWVEVQKQIQDVLGFNITLKTKMNDGMVQITAQNNKGLNILELDVYYMPRRKILSVEYIATDPYIKRGLAKLMMKASFILFNEVEIIQVPSLVRDNEDQLTQYIIKGLSREDATKNTPMYKILAQFGYTKIIPNSINDEGGFSVMKP